MGLWDKLKGELIDIVEFLDDSRNTMVHRFERYDNQIKNGAKLIVREGQVAAFVNQGQLADVFTPGTYTLETRNLPILSTLMGWKHGFNSPFKAEVYFVSTRQFTDLKWGTKNPIMIRDGEFGPVRLRAFGTYVIRVKDAGVFLRQIVGTDSRFTIEDISEDLRNQIVTLVCDAMAESKVPVLDMAGNMVEFGQVVLKAVAPEMEKYGIEVTKLRIENISLPPEVEAALDKGSSARVVGDMGRFTAYQTANAIEQAAKNPGGGGLAAGGMGMGMGFAMGNQMAGQMAAAAGGMAGGAGAGGPPPIPGTQPFFVAIGGQQAGPFDMATLRLHAQTGKLTNASLVWRQGMATWLKAGEVPELAEIFASAGPPPLPPGA